jgi:hypothetical protein
VGQGGGGVLMCTGMGVFMCGQGGGMAARHLCMPVLLDDCSTCAATSYAVFELGVYQLGLMSSSGRVMELQFMFPTSCETVCDPISLVRLVSCETVCDVL